MNRVQRLAAVVSELRARKLAEAAVPLAAEKLRAAGFRVHMTWEGGLSVDKAPGLDAKLAELAARGISPALVCILRDLGAEAASEAADGDAHAAANGDRIGGAGAPVSAGPATSRARVTDPFTKRRNNV